MSILKSKSLSQNTDALEKLREQFYHEPAEEDLRRILRLVGDCFDMIFDEFEKFKRAVEDIFNPIEEEHCNVSV
jgi:hypothetical protein